MTISGLSALSFGFFTFTSKQPPLKYSKNSLAAPLVSKPENIQPEPTKIPNSAHPSSTQTGQAANKKNLKINPTILTGVYSGPGKIKTHQSFEAWLGKKVPYATDYIDYKGGWQKDFVDSKLWLMQPWGDWVKKQAGRKLVLGVPMLQNENYGQFNVGTRGDFDNYFRMLAQELVDNGLGSSIIRLGYEANCDTIGPWQATNNPEGYKQLFRRQVAVLRSAPGSNFKIDWTVCNGLQNGKPLNSFASFYPGDDVVDIIGIDIYDVKWQDSRATPQQRWDHIVSRPMGVNQLINFAQGHKKPISVPEWGLYKPGDSFAGGGDNPFFIEKMVELMNATKPVYQSYFNIDWGGGVLSDFSQGEVTYKRVFGP